MNSGHTSHVRSREYWNTGIGSFGWDEQGHRFKSLGKRGEREEEEKEEEEEGGGGTKEFKGEKNEKKKGNKRLKKKKKIKK